MPFKVICFGPCVSRHIVFDVKPSDPQALLDIYLLDNIDEAAKHAIVSFLLKVMIVSSLTGFRIFCHAEMTSSSLSSLN